MMENNIMKDDFYKQLTDDKKQMCDLCEDWGIGDCEKCELFSHFSLQNNKQEVNNMNIVLYTIGCPNCEVLEKKLEQKKINFVKVSDEETLDAKGFRDSTFPLLEVDGVVMNYKTAIQWINNY